MELIEVEYDTYEPLIELDQILAENVRKIHKGSKNTIAEYSLLSPFKDESDNELAFSDADIILDGDYRTSMVQHCHIENHTAYAYMEDTIHITIVTFTAIPHILRRIVTESLGITWSRVRIVKSYVGGAFGNKQDAVLEPMVGFLTMKLNGRPVRITMSREECMTCTQNRHPMQVKLKTGIKKDGTMVARHTDAVSITGAYASYGHSVLESGISRINYLYPRMTFGYNIKTVYANIPTAGAMRGFGAPQIIFALESSLDDIARKAGIDEVEFRLKNVAKPGDINPGTGLPILSCGITECLEKGKKLIRWDEKKKEYAGQKLGSKRRGLGVACFSYASG